MILIKNPHVDMISLKQSQNKLPVTVSQFLFYISVDSAFRKVNDQPGIWKLIRISLIMAKFNCLNIQLIFQINSVLSDVKIKWSYELLLIVEVQNVKIK